MAKNSDQDNILFTAGERLAHKIWLDPKHTIFCSLLKAQITPTPTKKEISTYRYVPHTIASFPLHNRTKTGSAYDADDLDIKKDELPKDCVVYALLIHHGGTPIAYIQKANGLPLTFENRGLDITWDNGPKKIFKV